MTPTSQTPEELQEWLDKLEEELTPRVADKVISRISTHFIEFIDREVNIHVGKYLNLPFTISQVAIMFGETEQTIYKWHQRKMLEFTKVNGRLVITLKDISEQLEKLKKRTRKKHSVLNNNESPSAAMPGGTLPMAN